MTHIPTINEATASDASLALLDAVKKKLGSAPNLFRVLAHSPAALEAYLTQSEVLSKGVLTAKLREQVALVIAGTNHCDYCASAHTAIGKMAGLSAEEAAKNLKGGASDAKAQAVINFARSVVADRGQVSDADLEAARSAGLTDAEIVEIVAHVGMNTFTNYLNHIAGTEIDFPLVTTA